MAGGSPPARRWPCTCGSGSRPACRQASHCTRCGCKRGRISTRSISVKPEPGARRGRMLAESAVVEETPVWLEVNGEPAVTWMCTPDQLEELATGWLHGEGYIETLDDLVKLRPCATDLGFWAEVKQERVTQVRGENRKRVLASGCGAVSTFLADPHAVKHAPARGGRPGGRGLLVTGPIAAALAYRAARAGVAYVATPSVPSTLALAIARRAGVVLVGRAVSGTPPVHRPEASRPRPSGRCYRRPGRSPSWGSRPGRIVPAMPPRATCSSRATTSYR